MAGNLPSSFSLFGSKKPTEDKFEGEESYGDPKALSTGIVEDLKAIGVKGIGGDLQTLLEVVMAKGKPVDDKQMVVRNTSVDVLCYFLLSDFVFSDGETHCHHHVVTRIIQDQAQIDLYHHRHPVG